MKKTLLLMSLTAVLGFLAVLLWIMMLAKNLPDVSPLADPGLSFQIEIRGWEGRTEPFTVGPRNPDWTPLEEIPEDFRKAVLAGEDFSFYSHDGVDWYEVYESFKRNLRERRFARGASTITQQLAKNLFLSRDKTLKRKIRELILAGRMEEALSKDRILELYLNVVELGDMVYGVGQGARHHFGKQPSALSLRESAFLAAMLPGPRVYDPLRRMDRVMNRSDHLLAVMLKAAWITDEEYLMALNEVPFEEGSPEPMSTGTDPAMEIDPTTGTDEGLEAEESATGTVEGEPAVIVIPGHGEGIVEIPIED